MDFNKFKTIMQDAATWQPAGLSKTPAEDYIMVLYAQARKETGNFTSRIYRDSHNLFGMKPSKVRQQFHNGERYGHADYMSIEDSMTDRLHWDKYFNVEWQGNPLPYMNIVQSKGYAEDKQYVSGWLELYLQCKANVYGEDAFPNVPTSKGSALNMLVLVAAFIMMK